MKWVIISFWLVYRGTPKLGWASLYIKVYLFNITLSQRHNFSNKHMHFLPLHVLYLFFARNSTIALWFFLCALALVKRGCWLLSLRSRILYPTHQLGGKLARAQRLPLAETIWDWNGEQLLCLCYSCYAGPCELMDTIFCLSPACFQLQSLVLKSFQPSLKQGQWLLLLFSVTA